ncbi:MAG: hypothetical protein JNN07_16225 [Verrucomicrobiales bacterium]|nr:hypothetical protein [Verrucomicrobiales bacterium]
MNHSCPQQEVRCEKCQSGGYQKQHGHLQPGVLFAFEPAAQAIGQNATRNFDYRPWLGGWSGHF